MALPPVGEELLVRVQLEKEAVFTTRTASSGTKLSYDKAKSRGHNIVIDLSNTIT